MEWVPGVVRGAARWCGSARSTCRVHQGSAAGGRGLAMPDVPEHAGRAGEDPARWCSRGRSRRKGTRQPEVPSACGFVVLYGPVRGCPQDRRRGGPGARTYSGQGPRREPHGEPFPQFRDGMEMQVVAGCKTVGSAYVGSNPTPATTCENGPPAAEPRPGGPFPSRHAMYQDVSRWVDAWQCPRTYSGQRPGKTSGSYNRSLWRSGGRTGVVKTPVARRSPAAGGPRA